jgi:hypothetical protein
MASDARDNLLGDLAGVERRCTLRRKAPERGAVGWQPQKFACGFRRTVRPVVDLPRDRVGAQRRLSGEKPSQTRRNTEALFGNADRGVEQPGPGQAAMAAMGGLQQARQAGHADRAAADDRSHEPQGPPIRLQEQVRRRGGRRGFAPVERRQRTACLVPVQQKRTAAEAGALRLHQT